MENLGIGCETDLDRLQQVLKEIFPDISFYYWEIENEHKAPEDVILYTIIRNDSEFPIKLHLFGFIDDDTVARERYIARQVSLKLACRTIIPYQIELAPMNPYACVIFEKGKSYLANDYGTLWADGEGSEVKIIEPIEINEGQFDSKGKLQK